MNIVFAYSIGQSVIHPLGITGTVISACVSRSGEQGYWLEYLDREGNPREVYAIEAVLKP